MNIREQIRIETIVLPKTWIFLRSAYRYFNGLPTEPEMVVRFKNYQVDKYEV